MSLGFSLLRQSSAVAVRVTLTFCIRRKKYHFLAASRPRLRQKREEGGGL